MAEEAIESTEQWTHDTMIEGLWRTGEKEEVSILFERKDKSRYSGQAVKGSREWKDFFFKFTEISQTPLKISNNHLFNFIVYS